MHLPDIIKMHAIDYLIDFEKSLSNGIEFSNQQKLVHQNINHFTPEYSRTIKFSIAALEKMQSLIQEKKSIVITDLKILSRYINLVFRIKQYLKECHLTSRSS